MMNLFQARTKLLSKTRTGAKVSRKYEPCITPLKRLLQSSPAHTPALTRMLALCERTNPFDLDQQIKAAIKEITNEKTRHKKHAA